MPTKASEVSPGVTSTMRVGVLFYCLPLGAVTIVGGLAGWFLKLPDAPAVIAIGSGLISLALGAKAWQAQAEKES